MYTYTDYEELNAWNLIFSDICIHRWLAEKWIKKDDQWTKTNTYKKFDTLEEARDYCLKDLHR